MRRETEKNKQLNDELMALKSATNVIQLIQTEASEQQHLLEKQQKRLTPIVEEPSAKPNEEMNKLLGEAKTTIIELQSDLKILQEKVDTLQQQNDEYARELVELKSKSDAQKTGVGEAAAPMPLEPIVIVNKKAEAKRAVSAKVRQNRSQSNAKADGGRQSRQSHAETNSSDEDESSEEVDTYVVYGSLLTQDETEIQLLKVNFFHLQESPRTPGTSSAANHSTI